MWKFFYHYRRQTKKMSIHFRGECSSVMDVICRVPCHTKRNKRQPFLVMEGKAHSVTIVPDGDGNDTGIIQ